MTAPESLPCDCGAVVPVDRWGEHRRACLRRNPPLACDWLRAILDAALAPGAVGQQGLLRCQRLRDSIPGMKNFCELLAEAPTLGSPEHDAATTLARYIVQGVATIEAGQDAARATLKTLAGATR